MGVEHRFTGYFFASLLFIPWLVVHIPVDYFAKKKRHKTPWANQHPYTRSAS
jgi:hypothetical protein